MSNSKTCFIFLILVQFRRDATEKSEKGGYAFFETSTLPESASGEEKNTVSAMMESPLLTSTGSLPA